MSEPFVGQITMFGFNFAPSGWAPCNGQLLPISQNAALFSLLGTQFGGNGTSNFALPNLQGTVPLGMGQSAGGSLYDVGETGGVENVTLTSATVPQHAHALMAAQEKATASQLAANLALADGSQGGGRGGGSHPVYIYAPATAGPQVALAPVAVTPTGGNQPHANIQPTLTANWCIALQGVFPTRG